MPETERPSLVFPDRDHPPLRPATEFLAMTAAIDEHWDDDLEELPPTLPYTGSTYAVPVSGDHLARIKAAINEGEHTP